MKVDLFTSLRGLEHVVDYHLARHSVLATNLANADTPGFSPRELVDGGAADGPLPLATTSGAHLGGGEANAYAVEELDEPAGPDGNGVRLEQAMAQVAANRLRYEAGIEMLRRRLGLLRYAAGDGVG